VQRVAAGLFVLCLTLWAGALWAVGFMVAPTLFAALPDRALAGDLAGRLFASTGWLGLGCGAYLLTYLLIRDGRRAWRSGQLWLVLGMLACTAAGQFGIQPLLASLKAEAWPREAMQSAVRNRFATWHGISSVVYVIQSLLAFWFHTRFGVPEPVLGAIFFGANILAAISALAAARIARRIGLINTMVFTHLPSNVLLMLVPLMPTLPLAIVVLLARFSISQMDVPTRQSYTMAVVDPDERSAAAGVTGIARTTGAALSPLLAGPLLAVPGLAAVPFLLAGALKIVYDLALWAAFRAHPAPEDPGAPVPK